MSEEQFAWFRSFLDVDDSGSVDFAEVRLSCACMPPSERATPSERVTPSDRASHRASAHHTERARVTPSEHTRTLCERASHRASARRRRRRRISRRSANETSRRVCAPFGPQPRRSPPCASNQTNSAAKQTVRCHGRRCTTHPSQDMHDGNPSGIDDCLARRTIMTLDRERRCSDP